jgi:uncharacterized protein YneF (UPF0154 family)
MEKFMNNFSLSLFLWQLFLLIVVVVAIILIIMLGRYIIRRLESKYRNKE